MKKLVNLGKSLSREEMKQIFGGQNGEVYNCFCGDGQVGGTTGIGWMCSGPTLYECENAPGYCGNSSIQCVLSPAHQD